MSTITPAANAGPTGHTNPPPVLLGPIADTALRIEVAVNQRLADGERQVGRNLLIGVVADLDEVDIRNHVTEYRGIIRKPGVWPNHPEDHISEQEFVINSGRAALAYVDTGFKAARWLATKDIDGLDAIHRQAVASEALRGQLGKSSPAGLDVRLERGFGELLDIDDNEDEFVDLCIPAGLLTAEAKKVIDFKKLRSNLGHMPSNDQLIRADVDSLAAEFMRLYSSWSLTTFRNTWTRLAETVGPTSAVATGFTGLDSRRSLIAQLPPRAQVLVDFITALNILNLAVEPVASFKAGPGLLHGAIFREAAALAPNPKDAQLVLDRNRLLSQSSHIQFI